MRNDATVVLELMRRCDDLNNAFLSFVVKELGNTEGMLVMRLASYLFEFRNKGLI